MFRILTWFPCSAEQGCVSVPSDKTGRAFATKAGCDIQFSVYAVFKTLFCKVCRFAKGSLTAFLFQYSTSQINVNKPFRFWFSKSGTITACLNRMSCVILFIADRVAPAFRFCLDNSTLIQATPIRYLFLLFVTHHRNTYNFRWKSQEHFIAFPSVAW